MSEFRMPSLGADMEAGTLVEWMKRPGDPVKRGDIVAVVETQKGAIEIEIFETGTLDRLLVQPGAKVPVGTPLALVRLPGETPAAVVAPPPAAKIVPPVMPPAPVAVAPPPAPPFAPPAARPLASPAARRLAAERGIDLAGIAGTGPEGAIVSGDVAAVGAPQAKAPQAEAPARRRGLDLGAMRQAIAAAMARSKRDIPHYYLTHTIDMTNTLAWLETTNAGRAPPVRLLLTVLLVKAVARAARAMPEFNGFFENGAFRPAGAVHVGVAVAIRGGGLVAPAIHDTDQKTLGELMTGLRDLVGRVRSGRLRSSELFDPTITVSSLGERGVESLSGIIYPPQVALVGFGAVVQRPWIVERHIAPRSVMTVSLAGDHRVSDGHRGGLFLLEIERLLKEPALL